MSLQSLLINEMCPCWIRIIFFKKQQKLLIGSVYLFIFFLHLMAFFDRTPLFSVEKVCTCFSCASAHLSASKWTATPRVPPYRRYLHRSRRSAGIPGRRGKHSTHRVHMTVVSHVSTIAILNCALLFSRLTRCGYGIRIQYHLDPLLALYPKTATAPWHLT